MTADELKAAFARKELRSVIVDVPDVGKVMVREITVGDLDRVDYAETADAKAKNVALAIYTEDGTMRVFDPDNDADIAIIKRLGARTLNLITSALAEKN